MTHSSPGMCIDRHTNPHSFASPPTLAGPPLLRRGIKRLCPSLDAPVHSSKSTNAAFRRAAVCIANFKRSKCNNHITASFQTHAVLARGGADYGEGLRIPPLDLRRHFPFANADVAFQLPLDAYLPACDKHMPLPCDDDLHQHTTYRVSLSLLLLYQTYPKAARLVSLLPPSPFIRSRVRGTADSQAADHVSCAAMPARKRDTRLAAAGFRPPPSQVYKYRYKLNININIYIHIHPHGLT